MQNYQLFSLLDAVQLTPTLLLYCLEHLAQQFNWLNAPDLGEPQSITDAQAKEAPD